MRYRYLWVAVVVILLIGWAWDATVSISPGATGLEVDWRSWLTVIDFALIFALLILEVLPPDLTLLGGAAILVVTGILTPEEFLLGFAEPIIFAIGMLFVVVRAVQVNGILNAVGRWILPKKEGYLRQLLRIMFPVSVVSAFLNNTPIVLLMTRAVRHWAFKNELSPSRFLMPLSFAAMLGGICTLIGTATNLVVDGLLMKSDPMAGFSFFELGKVGLPCAVVGYLYFVLIGYRLVPERKEPAEQAKGEMREFTAEFYIREGSVLIGMTIEEAVRKILSGEQILEIGRNGDLIEAPPAAYHLLENDRIVVAGDVETIAKLHALEGLESVADPEFKLESGSPYFSEVVVAVNSYLMGKTLKKANFRRLYGASVVAIYREGRRLKGALSSIVIRTGDTLLLLSNRPWRIERAYQSDFYPIQTGEEVPLLRPLQATFVSAILIAMVVAIIVGINLLIATTAAAGLMLATRSLTLRQARDSIDWHLLLLIASAFAFGTALVKTGVAMVLARGAMQIVGTDPRFLIGGIFFIGFFITELITNVAAALLIFPIAVETVHMAGYNTIGAVKAVGVTIAIAASSAFLTPIGYQTNTIVYGPGGYKFRDYARVGWGLVLTQWVVATWLIPIFWPLG